MKCPNCNTKNNSNATVCINCGEDLPKKLNILLSSGVIIAFYFLGFIFSLIGFHLFTIAANVLLTIRIIQLIFKKDIYKRDGKIIRSVISVVFLVPFTPMMLYIVNLGKEEIANRELSNVNEVSETAYTNSANYTVNENLEISPTTLKPVTEVPATQKPEETQKSNGTQKITEVQKPKETQKVAEAQKPKETQKVTEVQKPKENKNNTSTSKPKETQQTSATPTPKASTSVNVSTTPDINKQPTYHVEIGLHYKSKLFSGSKSNSEVDIYLDDEKIDTLNQGDERIYVGELTEGTHKFKVKRKLYDYDTYNFQVGADYNNDLFKTQLIIGLEYTYGTISGKGSLKEGEFPDDAGDLNYRFITRKIDLSELVQRKSLTQNQILSYFREINIELLEGEDETFVSSNGAVIIGSTEESFFLDITNGVIPFNNLIQTEKYYLFGVSCGDDLNSSIKKMEGKGFKALNFSLYGSKEDNGIGSDKYFDVNGNTVAFFADKNDVIARIWVFNSIEDIMNTNNSSTDAKQNENSSSNEKNDLPRSGEISSNGQSVYGYTSPNESADWPVEDGWHITAVSKSKVNGETWYDCYDTDDGDHYGWIKEKFLYFY